MVAVGVCICTWLLWLRSKEGETGTTCSHASDLCSVQQPCTYIAAHSLSAVWSPLEDTYSHDIVSQPCRKLYTVNLVKVRKSNFRKLNL